MDENSLLLAFYGDDFTGSTDAMEALAINHYRTVLFLEAPTPALLGQFEGLRCFGVAGTSRAKNPAAMEQELRPIYEQLAKISVPLVHYKTCSTFDSSAEVGNIGKAIDVSRDYFKGHPVIPVLVGAPPLGRYTLFGQHFAKMRETIYRLDRHPTMARHPVTPMNEADLRLHLAQQTTERIALMDILELDGSYEDVLERFSEKLDEGPGLLLFDVLDQERLYKTARLVWEAVEQQTQFIVGSSGWEYALAGCWEAAKLKPANPVVIPDKIHKADQLLVVSGSCSPVTQAQIQWALAHGFHGIKVPIDHSIVLDKFPVQITEEAIRLLGEGANVLIYTASGPDDDAIEVTQKSLASLGIQGDQTGEVVGRYLGAMTRKVLQTSQIRRVVIAGGDTSGFVTKELGVYGLEMIAPVSPGAPLCKAYRREEYSDDLELALKGGQMGGVDYFHRVLTAGI